MPLAHSLPEYDAIKANVLVEVGGNWLEGVRESVGEYSSKLRITLPHLIILLETTKAK